MPASDLYQRLHDETTKHLLPDLVPIVLSYVGARNINELTCPVCLNHGCIKSWLLEDDDGGGECKRSNGDYAYNLSTE
jgi:hypothetical protein